MRFGRLRLLCGLALGLSACGIGRGEGALTLSRVASTQLEAKGSLRVLGDGFPVGAKCQLALRGQSERPGLASAEIGLRLPCEAGSESELVAPIDDAAIDALGGRGTFAGMLELRFAAVGNTPARRGAIAARFDVLAPIAGGPARERLLRERARKVLGFAGITLSEEEPTLAGLVVGAVRPASRADRAGVRADDVIVAANGVNLHSLLDLAPAPNAQRLALTLKRPRALASIELGLGLRGLFAPDPSAELSRASALLAWLLCAVLLLGPFASAASFIDTSLAVLAQRAPDALGFWGARRAPGAARTIGFAPIAGSVLGALCVWRAPSGLFAVRSFSIGCGFVALQVALALLSEQGDRRSRLRAAAGILARMLVLGIVVGCACALSGTRSLDGMVEGQGALPWQWALAQKPALAIAFPLYLAYAGQLGVASLAVAPNARGGEGWLSLQRVSSNLALAALGAAMFAGGWLWPSDVADERLAHGLGALLFVGKVWTFGWLFSLVRRLGPRAQLPWVTVASGCAISAGLCALWLWLEPSADVELAIGRALCASFAFSAVVTCVRFFALRLNARAA